MYQIIVNFLDIFYPLFKRFMNKRTYHYLACGGGNTLLALVLYSYSFHTLLNEQNLDLNIIELKPHIGAFFISFLITFPIGFLLSRYVVWQESNLPWKTQFVRHMTFVILSSILNYFLLKLFVEILHLWAMPSQIISTVIIVVFSYLTQRFFTFKTVSND